MKKAIALIVIGILILNAVIFIELYQINRLEEVIDEQLTIIHTLTQENVTLREVIGDKQEYIDGGCNGRYEGSEP